jgi:protein involved in polysaccharide export with SLBB domain
MKKYLFAAAFALAILVAPSARASSLQTDGVRVGPLAEDRGGSDSPAPKGDEKKSPAKDEKKPSPAHDPKGAQPAPRTGEAASAVAPSPSSASPSTSDAPAKPAAAPPVPTDTPTKKGSNETRPSAADEGKPSGTSDSGSTPGAGSANASGSNVGASAPGTASNASGAAVNTSNAAATPAVALTSVYRIGVGDVLDIRALNDTSQQQSTLFTVGAGGVLDHPLLRDPLTVAGMTTDELAAQLVAEFRHRGIYQRPQVRVSVREYASHAVLVSGLAGDPGTKILRREAIPLYVVIAEAQPKPEAGRAVIISHSTGKAVSVDLDDAAALNTLVQAGDVINLTARPQEFFYIGGEIGSPGQKDFHSGMTLTQAVLAAGGVTAAAGERVKVARAGADGRLSSVEYSLKEIEGGVVPDPVLQAGDRIEVARAGKQRR